MRRSILFLAFLALAAPAMAQQGTVTLDAMATPGRHFGIGYYVTDRLSLRPAVGINYSSVQGFNYNLGTDLRFEIQPANMVTAYATASINYGHSGRDQSGINQGVVGYDPTGSQLNVLNTGLSYGAGAGLRARVNNRFALFGEGRYLHSSISNIGSSSSFGQYLIGNNNRFELGAGVSLTLN